MFRIPTAVLFLVLSQATALAFDDQKFCEHLERSSRMPKRTSASGLTRLHATMAPQFCAAPSWSSTRKPSTWALTNCNRIGVPCNSAHGTTPSARTPAGGKPFWRAGRLSNSYTAPNGARERIVAVCSKTEARGIEAPSNDQVVALVDQSMRLFMTSVREKSMQTFWNHVSLQAQQRHSIAQLDEAFKGFYTGVSLKGDPIAGKSPVFNTQPLVDANGWLVVEGYYPTTPARLEFRLRYVAEGLAWKVSSINLKTMDPSTPPAK